MARKRRVVVVSCDAKKLGMMRELLKLHGYCGAATTTVRAAAQAMLAERTHLVVVELGHRWQGLEIVRELRAVSKEPRVMLVAFEQVWEIPRHEAHYLLLLEDAGVRGLMYHIARLAYAGRL